MADSPVLLAQGQPEANQKIEAIAFAPFEIWSNQLKSKLQGTNLDFKNEITRYQYANQDSSIQFVSERANFEANVQTQLLASAEAGLNVSLKLNQAKVQISNFDLQATIKKDLGFGTATLKLDMHCDAVELSLKNSNAISAQVKIDQGKFSLSGLAWDLKNSQLETRLVGCKEVAGFDQILKAQIQQMIEQSFMIESLQQLINGKINDLVNLKLSTALSEYANQFKIASNQNYHFDEKSNLWIYSGTNVEQAFSVDELEQIKNFSKAAVLIKKENLEKFAKNSLNSALKKQLLTSKRNSGLNHLTCSRLIQTFVWPSLKSLSKCFEMQIQTQVQDLKLTDLRSMGLSLKVGAWASGENHTLAYFESDLIVNLAQAEAHIKSFHGQADPEFIKWTNRSKRISTSLIRPTLEKLMSETIKNLQDSSLMQVIQKSTNLKELSPKTILVEVNSF